MDIGRLKDRIKLHEGFRSKVYQDTVGKWTIGYGRNVEDVGLSEGEADILLENDIAAAVKGAQAIFVNFDRLSFPRQEVLVEMVFNLGAAGLSKFHLMIGAVEVEQFDRAADEMLDSKWATQVGMRAKELADIMRNGF